MDYSKSGGPKGAKNTPRGPDHARKGAPKSVTPPRETKAELLARMKAAAQTPAAPAPVQKDPKG